MKTYKWCCHERGEAFKKCGLLNSNAPFNFYGIWRIEWTILGRVYMEWGTPVWWGWFLLFSRSGGHKTKETYPIRPGSPTPCKQGLSQWLRPFTFFGSSGVRWYLLVYFNMEMSSCPCFTADIFMYLLFWLSFFTLYQCYYPALR